jgi:hypothetical protein
LLSNVVPRSLQRALIKSSFISCNCDEFFSMGHESL